MTKLYRVLYRKYRPKYFADVIGQPQVTETLNRNELKNERLAHAYLFTGSRGTGKTTCSKILAKAVNCLDPHDGDPCGECAICRGIDNGTILDVVEIDAASNNGVDDIRNLREEALFTPAEAKYRVYIIDEVHMLSIGAFNALLKTLEEPPPHVLFILATTEVHKLPATILSRCQRFDFHRITPAAIAGRLSFVCQSEGVTIDENAALLIAGIADGAMRDALSLLDQCMGKDNHITEDIVRKTAGLADKSHLLKFTQMVMDKDSAGAIEIIDSLYRDSKDMARLCEELTGHFRELMLIKTVRQPRDIIVMSDDEYEKASAQALSIPLSDVINAIDILHNAHEKMLRGANRRIEMEMTAVKLCTSAARNTASEIPADLEKRLKRLESALSEIASGQISPGAVKKQSYASAAPPSKRPSNDEMEKLRKEAVPMTDWPEVLEEMRKSSNMVASSFDGSTAYISGKFVLVDSKNSICFDILRNNSRLRSQMKEAIRTVTGKNYSLGRYSYPDEVKEDDPLVQLISDFKSSGIPVDDNK